MYCQHCGAAIEPGMRFCPGCGAPRGSSPRSRWDDGESDQEQGSPAEQLVIHQHIHYVDSESRVREGGARVTGRRYTTWAWVALVFYTLYIPGLVINLIAWRSAVNFERNTGIRPAGKGCLVWLLWVVGVGLPLLFVIGSFSGPAAAP